MKNKKAFIGFKKVGKLDRKIYRCIAKDLLTDEVIITENQMKHILMKHPEVHRKVMVHLKSALKNPDYIFRDKNKNTGLVVKKIKYADQYIQMVLRIVTSGDDYTYKNSIISCWIISERRLKNYLRNKQILYKRE